LFAVGTFVVLAILSIWPILSKVGEAVAKASETEPGQIIVEPIHYYIDNGTAGLSLDATVAFNIWLGFGVAFFLFAWLGWFGARIGWVVFGASAAGMVWAGASPSSSRGISVGMTALVWSLLSVLALRRLIGYESDDGRPRRSILGIGPDRQRTLLRLLFGHAFINIAEANPEIRARVIDSQIDEYTGYRLRTSELLRGAAMQRRVDGAVERSGFDDIESYMKARWGNRKDFADELGAPEWFVRDLIKNIFPPKHGQPVGRTPWQIKDEAVNRRIAGESLAAVARSYGVSSGTVGRWHRERSQIEASAEEISGHGE
jgi:hypothetical protein